MISKSTLFRAWRTKRMIRNFLFEFYDGDQAKGTELLANMILEVQRDSFYEDNEITAISFLIENIIKASNYGEMEYTLRYKVKEEKAA
jgi:hypothetical protein